MSTEAKEPGQRAYEAWLGPRHGSAWLDLDDDGRDHWAAVEQACAVPASAVEAWVPVSERLPGDREHVLVCAEDTVYYGSLHVRICPCGGPNCIQELDPPEWRDAGENEEALLGVTHWMPLPQVPR